MKTPLPEDIIDMISHVVHYCAPTILAEMVDDWSQNEKYKPAAQIALNEGIGNCGLKNLAKCISEDTTKVISGWLDRGLNC